VEGRNKKTRGGNFSYILLLEKDKSCLCILSKESASSGSVHFGVLGI
jgi:hypothetical protein